MPGHCSEGRTREQQTRLTPALCHHTWRASSTPGMQRPPNLVDHGDDQDRRNCPHRRLRQRQEHSRIEGVRHDFPQSPDYRDVLYSCISTAVHHDGQATAPPNDEPIVVASPPGGPRYPGADRDVSRANSEGRGYAPRARQLVVGRPSRWTAGVAAIDRSHADDGCYGPLVSRYRTAHASSGWSGTVDPTAVIMTTPTLVSTKMPPPTLIGRRPSPARCPNR